ncbi:hypothetical protein SHKM778_79510 [Streptomyces sp. KM77-8]|uniref:DUF5666 domain-containing protein n=1 Tax=Streptomyces haneummycinicus TaxID=3074435 RepID=A0AAT9HVC1_9ACTN
MKPGTGGTGTGTGTGTVSVSVSGDVSVAEGRAFVGRVRLVNACGTVAGPGNGAIEKVAP